MKFYSEPEDCKWLRETALRGYETPEFQSFILEGNEDCPIEITLYADSNPYMDDAPVAIYKLVTGPDNLGQYQKQ